MADQEPDANEQFTALLEGLRATLPGVEVLFAFLLVLPFQNGFDKLDVLEKRIYAVAFGAAGLAVILLIAPSVHQRVRVPFTGLPRRSVRHVKVGAYLGLAGSVSAAIALAASAWLAVSVVYGNRTGAAFAVVLALLAAWAWFWIPVVNFRDDNDVE